MYLETKLMQLGQQLPDHLKDKVSFSDKPRIKFTWDYSSMFFQDAEFRINSMEMTL
jgi:hypothetical protein